MYLSGLFHELTALALSLSLSLSPSLRFDIYLSIYIEWYNSGICGVKKTEYIGGETKANSCDDSEQIDKKKKGFISVFSLFFLFAGGLLFNY